MRRPLIISGAVAAALVLATLSGCTFEPQTGETAIADLRLPTPPAQTSYAHQHLHWADCSEKGGDRDDCVFVTAPLDWRDPDGRNVKIGLLRHRATGHRLGSLVVDPGGPGESGMNLVADDVTQAVTADVAAHYDVIGIDPRGVGSSTAVDCGGAKAFDDLLYSTLPGAIGSAAWVQADIARSTRFADSCRENSGALLTHIDTVSVAHDLELIRVLLHQPKLDYLGYSYGSYLGTVYAGLYPKRVGRFVFDGIDDPWEDDGNDASAAAAGQAGGFDDALSAYLRACLVDDSRAVVSGATCPFSGDLATARDAVQADLTAASAHPVTAADGRRLNDQTLATAIIAAMYDPEEWADLSAMFGEIRTGRTTTAFRLADEYNGRDAHGHYDNSMAAYEAIECLEDGSDYDLGADRVELKQLVRQDPVLGPHFAYGDLACAGWDQDPAPWPDPVHAKGSGPILLVGTTDDPATPYSGATALARQLADGHLVTFHGEGHTAYDLGHACVDGAVDAYLLHGAVPAHDPECR